MTFAPNGWDGTSPSRPDPSVLRSPDEQDWATLIHEHVVLPKPRTAEQDSTVVSGLTTRHGGLYLTRLTFEGLLVTMTDAAAAGCHGGVKILELVTNRHVFLGVDFNLTILAGGTGIDADADIVGAIGSVVTAVDNATLLSAEADIHPSTAFTLVDSTVTVETGNVTPKTVDCTELFLNFACPGVDADNDDTLQVDGTLSLIWAPWVA